MRVTTLFLGLALLVAASGWTAADEPPSEPARDYADFSRLLHKMIVAQVPRYVEDNSGWGGTIPIPDKLLLPRLRVRVKVGDHEELPHGLWRKLRVTIDDPNKDVNVQVRDFKQTDPKTYRLSLDSQAAIHGEVELMHWQKGLPLFNITTQADATIGMYLDCDVTATLKPKTFPPEFVIEPKVTNCKLTLKQFELRKVGNILEGDKAREVGNDVKDYLQQAMTFVEPQVKTRVNEAIANSLRAGKGTFSAATLLRLLAPTPEKK